MPLTLTPVTAGSLNLTSVPTTQSTAVICSESLACSSSLSCGELGVGLALLDPTPNLPLTTVGPI